MLPSVNELSQQLGFARETVVKAYGSLRERGIVDAKQGIGYFVANVSVDQKLSIALILYGFQTFQQDFYNKFRKTLGEDYQIDVYFHHNNLEMYRSILANVRQRYGKYVVAPIQTDQGQEALTVLPKEKLLLIDRYQYLGDDVSSISQEFEISLSLVFEQLEERINNFDRIVLYYRDDADYPPSILKAFSKFCSTKGLTPEIYKEYDPRHLQANSFFFTIGDSDLWLLLKDAKSKDLVVGRDLGVLSHNDSPVKEIIQGGITTFSTDFELMAEKAANAIAERSFLKEILPCILIRRNSL